MKLFKMNTRADFSEGAKELARKSRDVSCKLSSAIN